MSAMKSFLFRHANIVGEMRFAVVAYEIPHSPSIASTLGEFHHFLHGLVIHVIFSHSPEMMATRAFEMPVHHVCDELEGKMSHRMQPSPFNR